MAERTMLLLPQTVFWTGVVVSLIYLPLVGSAQSNWRTFIKTLPLVLFAVASGVVGAQFLLTLGLALSAVGDLALSRSGKRAFLLGLIAFALAHLCYIVLFASYAMGQPLANGATLFVILAAPVVLALSTEFWLVPFTGPLKWPVRTYVLLITVMFLVSLWLPGESRLAILGAAMFVSSDLLLAVEVFRLKENQNRPPILGVAVWVLYVGAQAFIYRGIAMA